MTNKQIGRVVMALAGAFAVLSAQADYRQVRSGVTELNWATESWADADGNPVAGYPIGADADVGFPAPADHKFGWVRLAPLAPFKNFALNSVTGGPCWEIQFYNNNFAVSAQKLTIPYPDLFTGFWTVYDKWGSGALVLPATTEHSPKVSHVTVKSRFEINVPTARTKASVESLFGEGALKKSGAGSLTVKKGSGSESRLFAEEGAVEIVGRAAADDVDSVVPGAALHLDASVRGTLTTEEKEDGYEHVVEWRDVDGGPIKAEPDPTKMTNASYIPWCNTPYLCDEAVSPSGLRMVDFGEAVGSSKPTNCMMKLSQPIGKVREVFWVGRNSGGAGTTYFGDTKQYFFSGKTITQLFSSDASEHLRNGDLRVNNERVAYSALHPTRYGSDLSDVFVGSAAVEDDYEGDDSPVSLLGCCRYIRARTGCLRIGELFVYTNHLSASQRTRINDYLMNKWLKGHETEDFGAAYVGGSGSDATVSVPAGNVARIGALTVHPGTTLVKAGAGTLSVGTLSPSDATIQVAGGAVKLRAPVTVTPGIAPNAYIHLDADDEDSVVTNYITDVEGVDPTVPQVVRWNDCDGGANYATVLEREYWDQCIWKNANWFSKKYPLIVEDAANGHRALTFGGFQNSSSAWMWLNEHGTLGSQSKSDAQARIYEGFVVYRSNDSAKGPSLFGSSQQDTMRDNQKTRLISTYSAPAAQAALWTRDGVAVDPICENAVNADATAFHVVSFASDVKLTVDLIAKERLYYINGQGGVMIGEYILYDRRLTPAERRETIAFLMRKWLDRDLPGTATPSFEYAADAAAVVDADTATTLPSVSGGNGDLVKRGMGTVAVGSVGGLADLANIAVEGGELAVDLTAEEKVLLANVLSAAEFDYDAMNLGSFSNEVVTVGDVTRTNVISWADTKGRANRIAYSAQVAGDPNLVPADGSALDERVTPTTEHPTLKYVEMPDGVMRPTVDFGETIGVAKTPAGAGMHMRSIVSNIREIHTMYSDIGLEKRGIIVGARKSGSGSGYAFMRADWSGALLHASNTKEDVRNGYIAVDGETYTAAQAVSADYPLPSGFHLVSYAPLSAQWVGTLAMDRTARCGGCRISEQIAFTRELSADERAVLQKYLMRKWLGTPPGKSKDFVKLSAVAGTALDLGDVYVGSGTLAGGGTITAAKVDCVSKLEISGAVDKLTVEGEVAFADVVTVELTGKVRRLDAGVYEIFAADAIANEDSIAFTVTGDEMSPNRTYAAYRDGNSIFLKVEKKGFCVIIK